MNRWQKHLQGCEEVLQELRRHLPNDSIRSTFKVDNPASSYGHDFEIDEKKIGVRVAWRYKTVWKVTVGGKKYAYPYFIWEFNCHRHGRLTDDVDFFICLAKKYYRDGSDAVFVIPRDRARLTFALMESKRRRPYHGRFAPYLENWGLLSQALGQSLSLNKRVKRPAATA